MQAAILAYKQLSLFQQFYSDHSGSDPEEVFSYTSQKDHMLILADTRITTDMSAEF